MAGFFAARRIRLDGRDRRDRNGLDFFDDDALVDPNDLQRPLESVAPVSLSDVYGDRVVSGGGSHTFGVSIPLKALSCAEL